MNVIITEKPSVARDIAKVLKVGDKKDGYFEGNGYQISWAFGHLIRLVDPPAYGEEFQRWRLDKLPIMPDKLQIQLQDDDGAKKQFHTIKNLITNDNVEAVICATDAGREGELIFRHIYTMAECNKPIKRLWISSQTDKAIKEGFAALKDGNDYVSLYDSALSRSEADWIVGINATRAYTSRFSHGNGVMSVGRVQTPVLKLIVDRHHANINFKPETYYEIHADIDHENGKYLGVWFKDKETRLTDKAQAEEIVKTIKDTPAGKIKSISKKDVSENPPLLYDLTEIQKDANKKFKYSADQTLKLMQSLYEKHKILSYPRTSSRYLSNDIKPKIKGLLDTIAHLEQFQPYIDELRNQPISESKRLFDDKKVTDHHAIIPTDKKPVLSQLTEDERNVYELAIKRFLAGFMPNCKKELSEIISEFSGHTFKTTGTIIREPGWRNIYLGDSDDTEDKPKRKSKKDSKPKETMLPTVNKDDGITAKKISAPEKQTKAPPLYNEASILAAMETAGKQIDDDELRQAMKDCGLGTPATRAQILERLLKVGYIERKKNTLIPTEKGIGLTKIIQNDELLSPEMTGEMEKKLNTIVKGDFTREQYMEEIRNFTSTIIDNVKNYKGKTNVVVKDSLGKCPLCEGAVVETKMAYSCVEWKSTGCKFAIWKTIAKKAISANMAKELLKNGKTKVLKGFKSKAGNDFETALEVGKDGKIVFNFSDVPPKQPQKKD